MVPDVDQREFYCSPRRTFKCCIACTVPKPSFCKKIVNNIFFHTPEKLLNRILVVDNNLKTQENLGN